MGQINLTAQLVAAPAASSDQNFPSGTTTLPFTTTPDPKTYVEDSGRNTIVLNSAAAYVALPPLGPAPALLTQAHTLYLRSSVPMTVRLTFGAIVLDGLQIQGVFFMEFPPGTPLTLVEVKGAGTIEYYIAGNQ